MAKKWTLSSSFEHFGAKVRNQRWSWSAVIPDGSTVVVTLWKDTVTMVEGVPHYHDPAPGYDTWKDYPGNRGRMEHLKHAVDSCSGRFRAIVAVAKDTDASPREIGECYPWPAIWMRIISFDEVSGEWSAAFEGKD